jgi:anaerobic selenocysteine-containing dehydrogenase
MIGTAEDHHSNPLKIAIGDFKRRGGRFISINPVRTGYSAIADEWIPIRPGTDGALFMALLHELIANDLVDHAFLKRYTNAPQLVVLDDGEREGMFAHDPDPGEGPAGRWPPSAQQADLRHRVAAHQGGVSRGHRRRLGPGARGRLHARRRHRVAPSFQLLRDRVAPCTPEWAAAITGIDADRHQEARARARRDGAAAGVRAADRLDRRLGQAPRDDARRGRSRSTRCAAWRRIRTASRPCARWRC